MKIACISQPTGKVIPPVESGSIGIWIYQTAQRLVDSQTEVTVYAPEGKTFKFSDIEDKGVTYRYVPTFFNKLINKLFKVFLNKNKRNMFFSRRLYSIGYIICIALDIKKKEPDIVHLHNYSQFVPVIRFFNKKIKIVLHMHCEWLTQLDRDTIYKRIGLCDIIAGCSDYITDLIKKKFPMYADKCYSIYNGVDIIKFTDGFTPRKENIARRRILFVGRISPEKGLHTLFLAFNRVVGEFPDADLVIVGGVGIVKKEFIVEISEDPLVRQLERYYGQTKSYDQIILDLLEPETKKHVYFTGKIDHSQIVDYYHSASILVNPSLSESFGMSLIEAMASHLPVIATKAGGMTHIVEQQKTGVLVETDNSIELAEALIALLKDEKRMNEYGEAGYRRVKEMYSWDRIVDELSKTYRYLL